MTTVFQALSGTSQKNSLGNLYPLGQIGIQKHGVCLDMHLSAISVSKVVSSFETFTGFNHRWISFCLQTCGDFRFTVYMAGKARRFFLVHFKKSYIQSQLLRREGDCRQCGACCNLLFTCPTLMKNGQCLIYGACRPRACKVFPIDQRDIEDVKMFGANCGFRFRKTDLSKEIEDARG
jgi:hypothetical protein